MRVCVDAARVPVDQAVEQRSRSVWVAAVFKFDRVEDRVARVGVVAAG
ncbi:MAG TPA: hypothetical protein VMA77_08670 [Solirubrobacteraceae bacterium]|nr:hypothetical protein [Solirubrobacteraceae bacterium]